MKLITDERVKHRLIGLAVILSIAAIFTPAIMKKSSQRFDENVSISVKLPPKPIPPKVVIPEQKKLFESVKVAHVDIPAVDDEPQPAPTIARAEPLSQMNKARITTTISREVPATMPASASNTSTVKEASAKKISVAKPVAVKTKSVPTRSVTNKKIAATKKTAAFAKPMAKGKNKYTVQVATFSKQNNALALIAKLKKKGYHANMNKVSDEHGTFYKITVGRADEKLQAQKLQQQLINSMQLRGFIVTTEVS
ncbi:SPOR domain-containing protein [Legionella spiritensis]|uniref:SPOR domain-containing protein n=1 Tax=Legionella spiritensis TaxID=452 RepID=UPI000F6EDD90|nr:SPOR domain-containing protein [Legionella spiritensis]VEG90159.1 Sporulation domain-containing protein [Legionella spiritensis]